MYKSGCPIVLPEPILLILDKRQGLFNEIVAFAELVDSLMDQVAGNLVKAVSEVVKLLCMMPVMAQHVGQKSQSFFR